MTVSSKTKPPTKSQHDGLVDWRSLVGWLRTDGVITDEEAQRTIARCSQAESAQHPLIRLASVSMRRASDGRSLDVEALTQWLAGHTGLDYLRIDPLKVDVGKISDAMSAAYSERHRVLPVQVSVTEVVVATAEPFVTDWVAEVERQTRRSVRRVVASPNEIKRFTAEFYALAKSVRSAMKTAGNSGGASFEQLVELGKTNKQLDANDQGVVQVVDWLWQYAFDQRASDIHLEPRREQGVIRFRIDGILHPVYQMPMGVLNAMTARIKLLGRMDVVEKRRPQDGRIKTRNPRGDEIEMRISTLPTAFGEKMVMRIFDPDNAVKDLDALGFTAHDAQRWELLVKRPHGIILVTGPTGSGKTTTLYSTLKRVATEEVNVSTVEDPIEMIEPSFNQTQVQPHLDFSFAEGLRALMRQDPDIIMVGEIRDAETARTAMQAAITGHMVLSTIHTKDTLGTVFRLLDLGVEPYLVSQGLNIVVAQRLVRALCPACKRKVGVTPQQRTVLKAAGVEVDFVCVPVGCPRCLGTGHAGRRGVFELLRTTDKLRAAIQANPSTADLEAAVKDTPYVTLLQSGLKLVGESVASFDEVQRISAREVR